MLGRVGGYTTEALPLGTVDPLYRPLILIPVGLPIRFVNPGITVFIILSEVFLALIK
jgi:hypothetical protein